MYFRVHGTLETKVDGIIEKAFQNNAQFQGVVREAFKSVVNRRQNKPAKLVGEVIPHRYLPWHQRINHPSYHRLL